MQNRHSLQSLSDDQLLRRLGELTRESRRVEADLVAHIAEVDERRLFAREACSSMFAYCVEVLHLSEPETNLRIVVARASRRHPVLLDMLRDGRLHLSGIALLAPHLTSENREEVLRKARHQSKRRIEELVAELAPRPDVRATVRKLPEHATVALPVAASRQAEQAFRPADQASRPADQASRPDEVNRCSSNAPEPSRATVRESGCAGAAHAQPARPTASPARSQTIEPLAPARYRVQFTASAGLREKLQRLQVLMRRSVPDGDLAAIIEDAVTEKIARLEARRLGAAERPRKTVAESDTSAGPRHVPAAVKRAVREQDGDRCAYVDAQGMRCTARERLEFHHRHPHALGGDRSPANIALMCRAHNAHEAAADYGRRVPGPASGSLIGPAAPS